METTLYELLFPDGRRFRVFCYGVNHKKRLRIITNNREVQVVELSNGIHTIAEFEKIVEFDNL